MAEKTHTHKVRRFFQDAEAEVESLTLRWEADTLKAPGLVRARKQQIRGELLWMDEVRSHHFKTMRNHCLLVFTGESSFYGFSGDAGYRPSKECILKAQSRVPIEGADWCLPHRRF